MNSGPNVPQHEREPYSAPGDFYVENDCCTSCGVPLMVAPDLIGYSRANATRCYWKRQPETPHELQQAFAIFDGQEVGCHRYAGHDPKIQSRIGFENCDYPSPQQKILAAVRNLTLLPFQAPTLLRRLWDAIRPHN